MSRVKLLLVIILILTLIEIYNIKKPRRIFEGVEEVAQITLYDLGSKESVNIHNEDDINYYMNLFNEIIFNKVIIAGNSSETGLMVVLYDENGSIKAPLYLTEDTFMQRRSKLKVVKGENPYNELRRAFESRLLKDDL